MCRCRCCNLCCYCNICHSFVGIGLLSLCCACICYDPPTNSMTPSLSCDCIQWYCCKPVGCGPLTFCGSFACCANEAFDNEACELKIKEVSQNFKLGTESLTQL